jgi:hypothetical protein
MGSYLSYWSGPASQGAPAQETTLVSPDALADPLGRGSAEPQADSPPSELGQLRSLLKSCNSSDGPAPAQASAQGALADAPQKEVP